MGVVGADEALLSTDCSTLCLAATAALAENGAFCPSGGSAALRAALISTIRRMGGAVYYDVPITEIVVENISTRDFAGAQLRAAGIRLESNDIIRASLSVVSGLGAICTYTRLISAEFVSIGIRNALSKCSEKRPKIYVIFLVQGSQEELRLSSSDYVECEQQSPCFGANAAEQARAGHGKLHETFA